MASDLSGTAKSPTGYGSGGAGGGEYSSKKFCSPSAGANGYAAVIQVSKRGFDINSSLWVNNGGTVYPAHHLFNEHACSNGSTTSISKMTLTVPKIKGSRTYNLNPLKIFTDNSGKYAEINSSLSNGTYKVVGTKIYPSGSNDNLKLLINTNKTTIRDYYDTEGGSYPLAVTTKEGFQDGNSSTLDVALFTEAGYVYYILLQGAGGGGGGADNEWKFLNYASGGGGGGGGAACVVKLDCSQAHYCRIYVGQAGSAGKTQTSGGTSGGSGGSTKLAVYLNDDNTQLAYEVTAGGGGGGGGGDDKTHGSGGHGGSVSKTYHASPHDVTVLYEVSGGKGGTNGGGGNPSGSGSSSDTRSYTLCSTTLTIDTSTGSGGSAGSSDDKGGGGGGSWLGSGGYY